MENEVIGFDALKDLYVSNPNFGELVKQLKDLVVGNVDLICGE